MVKAKDIRIIKYSLIKYKDLLDKETDFIQKFKIESKIREQQYKLMDVESQLFNIEICLHKDAELHKEIFMDKYINGLTATQLVVKYDMSRTSIHRLLQIARTLFEK